MEDRVGNIIKACVMMMLGRWRRAFRDRIMLRNPVLHVYKGNSCGELV